MNRFDPTSNRQRFIMALDADKAHDTARAVSLYEEILEADPDHAEAAVNLGTMYFHLRQFPQAEELYLRAIGIDPDYTLAHFNLGNVLDELGRWQESIASYLRAISLSPRYADAHYNLALAYERTGKRRAALGHWQTYLRLDNQGSWADHARGRVRELLSREGLFIVARSSAAPAISAPQLSLFKPERII